MFGFLRFSCLFRDRRRGAIVRAGREIPLTPKVATPVILREMIPTHLVRTVFAALVGAALVSGCSEKATHPGGRGPTPGVAVSPRSPFAWAGDTLESAGTGSAPRSIATEPQRSMAGKLKAKRAAIASLRQRVAQLPVTPDQTLGTVMNSNIGIRRSVEAALDKAQIVWEQEVSPGVFEVRVRTPLNPVADILEQNFVTPENAPAAPAPRTEGEPAPIT